jgi:hypothetical protein
MSLATVRAGIDTFAASDHPSVNNGASKSLTIKASAPIANAYLWFTTPVPLGATVLSATLRLYGKGAWGAGTVSVSVQRLATAWKSATLTYSNRPLGTGPVVTLTQANAVDGTEWDFNVAALLQTVAAGAPNYGWLITTTSTTSRTFYSLESSVFPPTLDVSWSDAPSAPHTLSPSSGNAVTLAKPIMRCDYVDVAGSVTMAAIQVQIDAAANWVTPAFDSGTVASAQPQLDLSLTAYAGLALNATTSWRVRVQDAAGLWSAWSDPTTFKRVAQGTLALNNPALSPNNFVTEWTPPITWALTGATQVAWRVTIALGTNASALLHDTGRRTGSDTAYTLPFGVLTLQGAVYVVTVYTWDAAVREATPNDPTYAIVYRYFTFTESAATAPVTGLTAASGLAGVPGVALHWSRSTAPDSFSVVRDGVIVLANIAPGDLFVSGTAYQWFDAFAPANIAHTWKVQAIVNGVASSGNPSATLLVRAPAVWLFDPTTGMSVALVDAVSGTFSMPDVAATYEPLGSVRVVRVVQSQRGLEGSLSGRLTDYAGKTARAWEVSLLVFKSRPTTELRMLIGNQALRVLIGNVSLAPIAGASTTDRNVSFDFWSLDGVPS